MKRSTTVGLSRRFLFAALASCLTLVSVSCTSAQPGLTGYWDLKVPNEDGTFRNTYFQLKQNGETLTGKLFGRNIQGTLIKGTVKDGTIHFETLPPVRAAGAPPNDIQTSGT